MVSSKLAQSILVSRLPSPLPEYRPLSFHGPNPDLQKKLAEAAERRVVPESVASGVFRNNLEKHLNDVRKNRGYLSQNISKEVRVRHEENSSKVNVDQTPGSKYSAYYTALSYEQRARYTAGVNDATRAVESIQNASQNTEMFAEMLAAQPVVSTSGVLVSEEV